MLTSNRFHFSNRPSRVSLNSVRVINRTLLAGSLLIWMSLLAVNLAYTIV